jgi:hypothetical protein
MPTIRRDSAYPLKRGGYGIPYCEENGDRQRQGLSPANTAARE